MNRRHMLLQPCPLGLPVLLLTSLTTATLQIHYCIQGRAQGRMFIKLRKYFCITSLLSGSLKQTNMLSITACLQMNLLELTLVVRHTFTL
jgi:hypothetical protein